MVTIIKIGGKRFSGNGIGFSGMAMVPFYFAFLVGSPSAGEFPPIHPSGSYSNPTPSVLDGFGMAVAANQAHVLIGAPHDTINGMERGRVYLFEGESGQLLQTFLSPHQQYDDLFGFAVGFAGGEVLVGAPQGESQTRGKFGAAYLFSTEQETLIRTFQNPMALSSAFGHALASNGSQVLIGDPMASTKNSFYTGAAYLFDIQTETLLYTFGPPESRSGEIDRFGHSVAFSGQTVLIGAPLGGQQPLDTGEVYLFDLQTKEILHTLRSPNPSPMEYFGWSLGTHGNRVVIGALGHNAGGSETGAAYLFDSASGHLLHILKNPHPQAGDHFGEAVALQEKLVGIGTPGDDTAGVDAGAVYFFDSGTGQLSQFMVNPSLESGVADLFGFSLSVTKTSWLVGAPFSGSKERPDVGMVYWFDSGRISEQTSNSSTLDPS